MRWKYIFDTIDWGKFLEMLMKTELYYKTELCEPRYRFEGIPLTTFYDTSVIHFSTIV